MTSPRITSLPVYPYRADYYHAQAILGERHYHGFGPTRHTAFMEVLTDLHTDHLI